MSIFFLMCSERSGSNFITKLLNGHRDICGPSTKHIINPVARNLFRYKKLTNENNWNELLADISKLMNVGFSIWKKEFTLEELRDLAPVGDVKSLIRNIFMEEARANGKQHVFIKENQIYEFLPFLLLNFPEAKYIYQTRDPRDMALSWKKNSDHYGGVVQAAKQWTKDQKNTLKNYAELAKIGRAYFVRYEDLISDPDKFISEIIHFLGLPYDVNIENFYKDELTLKNSGMQKAWNNLSQGIMKNNKKKYLKGLSADEIKAIEKLCYNEMQYLGYETEHSKEELDFFLEAEVEKINKYELKTIEYVRSVSVKDNMRAKKVFYQKTVD
jgi:hypothetical protein